VRTSPLPITDTPLRAPGRRRARLAPAAFVKAPTPTPDAIREDGPGLQTIALRDRTYRRMLMYADLLSAALALVLVVSLVGDDSIRATTWLGLPMVVLVSKVLSLYDRDELLIRKTTMDEAPKLFQAATTYTLVFWLLDDQLVDGRLGDAQVLTLWASLFTFAFFGRRLARMVAQRATPAERLLFIGDAAAYDRLASKLSGSGSAELVGRMSLQRVAPSGSRTASVDELRDILTWTDVHRVIIEPQALPANDMLDFVRAAKSIGVKVSLLPRVLDVVGTSVVFDDLHGVTVLGVRRFGLTNSSRLVKRGFDLAGAITALVALGPLMLMIAAAIRLDSRGPILFRQTRVGRDGKHFRICKFRTMVSDAEQRKEELRSANEAQGGLFKMENDPRITRVGRFLRKTSLDELPQLLNVLAGNMSLVGPRPLVVDEDDQIKGWDRRRLQLTPGMTGPWQILGSSRVPLPEMVKIDYLYVAGWSLWEDLKILLRTVPYMLARKGM